MAKSKRTRCMIPSKRIRAKPYKFPSSKLLVASEWENVICSVCMESPHNAVLLLCSSHDNGCRPYMCGTSFRYSNCLDQYKKASAKLNSSSHQPIDKSFTCPLCRGQVKGWTIVQPARDYLNLKRRICMQENCVFAGTFKELRKHMRMDHPRAQPRELNPDVEQNWRRIETEHERDDVISTIPGAMVVGDYVLERNNNGGGEIEGGIGRNLMNLMVHVFGSSWMDQTSRSSLDSNNMTIRRLTRENFSGEEVERHSNSLASRMRRQGRVLLGRSERRRRNREANQNTGPPLR